MDEWMRHRRNRLAMCAFKIIGRTDRWTPPYTPIIITWRIHTASLPLINTHVHYVPHVRDIHARRRPRRPTPLDRAAATDARASHRESRVMKYVVVSGGVVSGLGKGVTASSIGVLLKASGLRVTSVKIDPYINIDAGTMSPFEHGETYVLDDGGESDLDLGNYERFVDVSLTRDHNVTTGKVYQVREARRRGAGMTTGSRRGGVFFEFETRE